MIVSRLKKAVRANHCQMQSSWLHWPNKNTTTLCSLGEIIKSPCHVEFVINIGLLATECELQSEDSFQTDDYELVIVDISELPTFQGCILIPLGLIIKTKLWYVLSILHFRKD